MHPVIHRRLLCTARESGAYFDLLYAGIPPVHLFNFQEQQVVELLHSGLQDRLQPEDPPGPRHGLAGDHVPVALRGGTKQSQQTIVTRRFNHFQQSVEARGALPRPFPPSIPPSAPTDPTPPSLLLGLVVPRTAGHISAAQDWFLKEVPPAQLEQVTFKAPIPHTHTYRYIGCGNLSKCREKLDFVTSQRVHSENRVFQ